MLGIAGVSSTGSISPLSLPGLVLWLDVLLSPVNLAIGPPDGVNQINDLSLAGNHMKGTAPNRPVYQFNTFSNLLKPGMNNPSSATNFLATLSGSAVSMTSGFSIHTSIYCATVGSGLAAPSDVPFVLVGNNLGNNITCFGLNGNQVSYTFGSGNTNVNGGANLANNLFHTIAMSHGPSQVISLYADGILVFTSTGNAYPGTANFSSLFLGASNGDEFNNGSISEMIIANSELTATQFSALNTRSKALWAP
jgi:Concanavalin A-like lectin/glucanases superfamily